MKISPVEFRERIAPARLLGNTKQLWSLERGQTIESYHASARLVEKLLLKAGLSSVERISFPADGETVYQDKTSPLAWTATVGQLELLDPVPGFKDPFVADFRRHPFHLIKGSVATPPEGIETQLISEDDVRLGVDVRGKMVLLHPETRPAFGTYRLYCELGALGVVSDNLSSRYITPHGFQWVNGFSEGPSWHARVDSRPLIGFSISPITGDRLRQAMRDRPLRVRVTSDGRRFADTVDVVTAIIPGECSTEVWLMAHLYEPLPDDNSAGVAAAIEIARVIRNLFQEQEIVPRHTLRLIFGHELYGFAAYAASRGEFLGDEVLCALNLDGLPVVKGFPFDVRLSQPGTVSCAEFALQETVTGSGLVEPRIRSILTENDYSDDQSLADPKIGIATFWMRCADIDSSDPCKVRLWHCSEQTMERFDSDQFCNVVAMAGTWAAQILAADSDYINALLEKAEAIVAGRLERERERLLQIIDDFDGAVAEAHPLDPERFLMYPRLRFELEQRKIRDFFRLGVSRRRINDTLRRLQAVFDAIEWPSLPTGRKRKKASAESPEVKVAGKIVPTGRTLGFPYDLAAVPIDKRRSVAGNVIYGPLASILANIDGHRNLNELICLAEWESGRLFNAAEIAQIVGDMLYLSRWGYVDLSYPVFVDEWAIRHALQNCGIKPGDCIFLHSELSSLGPVDGGPGVIIHAILGFLGEKGTLLVPTFTRSFCAFDGKPARSLGFRAFNPNTTPIWTGSVPSAFCRFPGVIRSPHPTHSVAGIGPLAAQCLAYHRESDPPTGSTSPFAYFHEHDVKIVFLGADLSCCTYLHFLEDQADLPYLLPATCIVEDQDGHRRSVTVPKHLPGPRNFYRRPGAESKAYKALFARGLKVYSAPVGEGKLQVISARQLYEIGTTALRDDPELFV